MKTKLCTMRRFLTEQAQARVSVRSTRLENKITIERVAEHEIAKCLKNEVFVRLVCSF